MSDFEPLVGMMASLVLGALLSTESYGLPLTGADKLATVVVLL